MNAYILNPYIINPEAWTALLEILKIDCIIDLVNYKPEVYDPKSSYNEIFDNSYEKYNMNDFKFSRTNIISFLIDKCGYDECYEYYEEDYYNDYTLRDDDITNEESILIFCLPKHHNSFDSLIVQYYNEWDECYKIYKQKNHSLYYELDCIEFIKLNFLSRESFRFNSMNKKRDSYRKWLYTDYLVGRRSIDFINDEAYFAFHADAKVILENSKKLWIEEYYFDVWKREKKCERMNTFFFELERNYFSEQDFFPNNVYHKIIANRESHDSQCIEKLIEKENEKFWENANDFW